MNLHEIYHSTHLFNGSEVQRVAIKVRIWTTDREWTHPDCVVGLFRFESLHEKQLQSLVFARVRYARTALFGQL